MNDLHSLAHAYVVGALTQDESREFERHLIECAACSADVIDIRAVASALSTTVAVDPPPRLRAAILARIAQTGQEPTTPDAVDRIPVTSGSSASRGSVLKFRPSRRRRVATSLVAAAAVVAAVGFGGWAYQANQDAENSQRIAAEARNGTTEIAGLLSSDDVRTVSGRFPQTDYTGTVVMSKRLGKAIFVAEGLPNLPDDKVYEAWTINGDEKPAGTFTGDQSILRLSDAAFTADSLAITVEPEGGSTQPTSAPIFTVVLPQA
ncbi:MAG: anti-sigma factor [Nocardioidaceae bacterium]|nr:anti-sigma factor [Nocardioidaceae bacterium]